MLAVLLAGICGISAFSQNEFRYTKTDLQTDKCNICYDLRCYIMDKARCTYYSLTNEITGNKYEYEEQNEVIDEVDDMIFEFTEKASNAAVYKDCIPLISQYTNCNRDNICTGCKTCNCDSEGRWNCTQIQHCRPDRVISVNHHTLVIMIEKLNDYKAITNIRRKRSVLEGKEVEVMSPQEILKWMYGVKELETGQDFQRPTIRREGSNSTKSNNTNVSENTNSARLNLNEKNNFNESEYDPLVFEDILNNLNINDDKINISLEDKSPHSENVIYGFVPPFENELTSSLTDTTILDDGYQRNRSDTDSIIDDVFAYINSDINQNFKYKRDINHSRRLNKRNAGLQTINVSSILDNNTDKVTDLQNIISPFNSVIQQKQEELDKLIDIRGKLISYIKSFPEMNINNSSTITSNKNITEVYFIQLSSFENLDDFRKHDPNNLNKYLLKFKMDIHEVVRDIAVIQRLSNYSAIPNDLKLLIRAMRNYVNKDKNREKITNYNNTTVDLRKKFDTNIDRNRNVNPIDEIIQILELLDDDMPTFNILNSLSPDTRKILKRLIKIYYKNNLTSTDSPMNRKFNLSTNLDSIGKNWNEITMDIARSSLSDRLYGIRLFYIVLSLDILKIEDALALFQFAQSQRMAVIDDVTGERLIDRIDNDLRKSDRRFNHITRLQALRTRVNSTTGHAKQISKKKSFLQHIKTLLKNSKLDIRKLLHRKMPKSEIIKHIARKKIDEIKKKKLAEYEQTVQKWQNNLNVISRYKRTAGSFQNFINSIKNLFPGYRTSNKKKGNKTEKVLRRSSKRGPTKKKKRITTTQKTTTTHKQK